MPEEPDVVASAQDHASFAVAGGANFPQLSLAVGAFQTAGVPVALHGEEQETISDSAAAAGTGS